MSGDGRESRLRVGVVGLGTRGRRYAATLAALPEVELVGVYDQRPEVASRAAEANRGRNFSSLEELSTEVEAAVLAVPTFAKPDVGQRLLGASCHLLIDQPIALDLSDADRLLSASGQRVVAVGHFGAFNPSMRALLAAGVEPQLIELQTLLPFTPRALDLDVVLDLMLPQIQLLHAIDSSRVVSVEGTGIRVLSDKVDIVTARIVLGSGAVVNMTASRAAEVELSQLRIFQRHRYYCVDLERQEIRGFGLKIDGEHRLVVPDQPTVHQGSPLRLTVENFVSACRGEASDYVTGQHARRALATASRVKAAVGRS